MQHGDGGTAACGAADYVQSAGLPGEMIRPNVLPWIEECDLVLGYRVRSGNSIRPEFIALMTTQPQVFSLLAAATRDGK